MPGARCTRSRACSVESMRVSHHRFTGTPGLPCAMVLTVSFALSPVTEKVRSPSLHGSLPGLEDTGDRACLPPSSVKFLSPT
jgi:hypothetical protein